MRRESRYPNMEHRYSDINLRLKAAIVEKYGAQYIFARALGVREKVVSMVVRKHIDLSPKEQIRWSKMLGIKDTRELFG